MKVIFSRKGSDSGSFDIPSPIFQDKPIVSIPIPADREKEERTNLKYGMLRLDRSTKLVQLMRDLEFDWKGKPISKVPCHLDPDVHTYSLRRESEWRGLFGPDIKLYSYLTKQDVKAGDLFLFYGWFRDAIETREKFGWDEETGIDYRSDKQVIFGYLQIGEILRKGDSVEPWMKYHPHSENGKIRSEGNALYVASEHLSFDPTKDGFGTFIYDDNGRRLLTLTKKGETRSRWNLPSFFKGHIKIEFRHDPWSNGYFQSPKRGQEMVVEDFYEGNQWVRRLFESVKIEN